MLSASTLTFQEFVMREPLPLATIQDSILEFLRGRDDTVLFGAQAVNAYVPEPRMSQEVDLVALRPKEFAHELRDFLHDKFNIAVRIREVQKGRGYRLYQVRKNGNRHLVDVRPVEKLPAFQLIDEILVMEPAELIAHKLIAFHERRGQPKSGTDWRDLAMLLLRFPEFKSATGPVRDCLESARVDASIIDSWEEIAKQEIRAPEEDDAY